MLLTLAIINIVFGAYMIGSTNGDNQYKVEQTQIEQLPAQRISNKAS